MSICPQCKKCFGSCQECQMSLTVRNSTRPTNYFPLLIKCVKCHKNPIYYLDVCIECLPNKDIGQKCYNCETCIKERQYLQETNNIFTLVAYKNLNTGHSSEIWSCLKCNKCIEIQLLTPGIEREILHKKMRFYHLRDWCEKFRTGILSF